MEPTLNEVGAMYKSMLKFKNDIQKEVGRVIGENEALDLEIRELYLRELQTSYTVQELNEQYQELHRIYKTFRRVKEERLVCMRERIDELKVTMVMKQKELEDRVRADSDPKLENLTQADSTPKLENLVQAVSDPKLEDLVRADSEPDVEAKAMCGCNVEGQPKLVYNKIDQDLKMEVPRKPVRVVEQAATVKARLPPDGRREEAEFTLGYWEWVVCTGWVQRFPPYYIVRDLGHLFQLKSFLTDQRNIKKVTKPLKEAEKKAFKGALERLCETLMEDLSKPFEDLNGEMLVSLEAVESQFELCLGSDATERIKGASLQRFRHFLKKFWKKYPLEPAPQKKPGFLKKVFGRSRTEAKLEAHRREQLEIVKEMLRIEKLRGDALQKRLDAANSRNQLARKYKTQLQNQIILLNTRMNETKLEIQFDAISFRDASIKQDAEISELKKEIQELECSIKLNDFCMHHITSELKIDQEFGCLNEDESQDVRIYVCDIEL